MAQIKGRKKLDDFRHGIKCILIAHSVVLSEVEEGKLLDSLMTYFANKYKPDEKTMWWTSIVSFYFQRYREITGDNPAFLGVESKALKSVAKVLQDTYLHKNKDGIWDEETCIKQFANFYNLILAIPLVEQNFSISYIHNNLDKFRSQLAYKRKNQNNLENK